MGALTLLPSERGGPCTDPCSHPVCARHRELASAPCVVCRRPLGYGTPVYCYEARTGHVACIEEAVNRSLLGLLEGFTELAVRHHLETDLGWREAEADRFASTMRSEMERRARTSPPRVLRSEVFLLPSHDLQCEIPSGRTKKPTIHIEDHTTLLATRKFVVAQIRTPQKAETEPTELVPAMDVMRAGRSLPLGNEAGRRPRSPGKRRGRAPR